MHRSMRSLAIALLAAAPVLGSAAPATAHPHIIASVEAEVIFGEDGALTAIRQSWSYDPAYSAFAMRQIDTDRDGKASDAELAAYAKQQVEALAEFRHFTMVKTGGHAVAFVPPQTYAMRRDDAGRLTLSFELPLKAPTKMAAELTIDVFDSNFFAYFTTSAEGAVRFVGTQQRCESSVISPEPINLKNTRSIPKAFWAALDGSAEAGRQFVNRITVTCP